MTAREEVLARIRIALGRPGGTTPPGPSGPNEAAESTGPSGYRSRDGRALPELLDLLTDRLADYGAAVSRVSQADLPGAAAAALRRRGARRVVLPPGLDLDLDLDLAEPPAEMEFVVDSGLSPAELDGFDAVITAAAIAIAETGTIILDGSADQGRRALSLIPDYHLCLVRADQVVGLVPEALPRLDPTHPLTWISGPSATSDIELDRVQGVHGPRTLDVILIQR